MSRADFWSRRKAAVEVEAETVRRTEEIAQTESATAEKTDEEVLADLGLPDPDSLERGDDFSAFLQRAVPERLRRRALRRLWLSDPVLANLDGLVDYGEDFNDARMAVTDFQTAYQVGKGMAAHVEALLKKADPAPDPPLPDESPAPDIAQTASETPPEEPAAQPDSEGDATIAALSQDNYGKPRRMRYSFPKDPGEDG